MSTTDRTAPKLPTSLLRRVRYELARQAYAAGQFRLVDGDLHGAECLVSSRQGLFACSRSEVRPVAYGLFFGLALHDGWLYLFEACDRPANRSMLGRIVRLRCADRRLAEPAVLVTGLDNNCHQLAIIDSLICLVDTANQVVRRHTLEGETFDVRAPLPTAQPNDTTGAYRHMNSIAKVGEHIALVLHNGAGGQVRPSELALLDADWRLAQRRTLAGRGCHDVLQRADGALMFCGSLDGEVIDLAGERTKVCSDMTRGLAMNETTVMVGATPLLDRAARDNAEGWVYFLDHALARQAVIETPGAPTALLAL